MISTRSVASHLFVDCYTQPAKAAAWMQRYCAQRPVFACVLGFTQTGLIPGISAAGATPRDRQFTAIADAEFLINGPQPQPQFPLPPLDAGASPVLISRAIVAAQAIPVYLFNAGLPTPPPVAAIDLGGCPAQCVSSGQALPLAIVEHLWQQGLRWGKQLATELKDSYLIVGECVVGGTTTALGILTGLGFAATGKVNSSHPICNHTQKQALVMAGFEQLAARRGDSCLISLSQLTPTLYQTPLELVAAVGDPMQIVVAGMAIAASRNCGVMLAGGTQMLAVAALAQAIAQSQALPWNPEAIVIGTTRWVAADPTGDTAGLARMIGAFPLIATPLSFAQSRHPQLQAYEQGFVKEGVGAGGCAIAAALYQQWGQNELLTAIDQLGDQLILQASSAT
jgi:uncharacterized protein (TIGR00303 family)